MVEDQLYEYSACLYLTYWIIYLSKVVENPTFAISSQHGVNLSSFRINASISLVYKRYLYATCPLMHSL